MELTKPGYSDGDIDTNVSLLPTLNQLADERFSRRQTIMGSLKASALAFMGTSLLAACDDDAQGGNGDSVVNAGEDVTTTTGNLVTLNATSTGGAIGGTTFTQTGGPALTLLTRTATQITFIAPAVSATMQFTFQVVNGGLSDTTVVTVNPATLGFTAVAKNLNDVVTVPAGYSAKVLTALGDPITAAVPAFRNDGTDTDYAQRIGDHGDALYYFGLNAAGARDDASNTRGLLVQNHENLSVQYLHPSGPTNIAAGPRPAAEAIKEIEAHGVSVMELRDASGNRDWATVPASSFNRRITPNTPVAFNGPVRGTSFLVTKFSAAGTEGRGTINNCANGHTNWGTLLTCEENWAGYFRRDNSGAGTDNAVRTPRELTALRRYGVNSSTGNYAWSSATPTQDLFARWDARATGTGATDDYRNEPNHFGWVVEIDPYDPASRPRKRTALGRMGHEGAWISRRVAGQRPAFYMGDDARREYFYKFVSATPWEEADAARTDRLAVGDKYLDNGTLYVAKFNADGTGQWLPLVFGQVPDRAATSSDPAYVFASQADILVNARLAADALGATPMDRPEWTAVNPVTGEVYLTLTNNNATGRPLAGTDAANPRHYIEPVGAGTSIGNPNGHIVRIREGSDNPAATGFLWDIYLFGADSTDAGANVNLSGLTAENDFSSPDGLWFGRSQNPSGQVRPLLWLQTDDSALADRTNNQMLAALPGFVGDGAARTITNTGTGGTTRDQATIVGQPATPANLKRFLTGPKECEITGVDTTPDGRTLFVGIQHPGEDGAAAAPTSNWPQSQAGNASGRPRSGVVAITRNNGGVVGL